MRTLTPEEAKTFYDEFGAKQDKQGFYEERALNALCANGAFQDAKSVFEFGCGTGSFALRLLERWVPGTSQYFGTDISSTMVTLASRRVSSFAPRASVALASDMLLPLESASVDRFVSNYVLDLLPTAEQRIVLADARRVLRPDGLLCLAGITFGSSPLSRFVMTVWQSLFARNSNWVGGCRPCRIADDLPAEAWHIHFRTVVVAWGVASEVVVACPLPEAIHASLVKPLPDGDPMEDAQARRDAETSCMPGLSMSVSSAGGSERLALSRRNAERRPRPEKVVAGRIERGRHAPILLTGVPQCAVTLGSGRAQTAG